MLGQTLRQYRLVECIGEGGMGVVYRAADERLERDVAVKVLHDRRVGDDTARRQFRREAAALSRLNHPNVATVHDFDSLDDTDFLVMEFIPGETLAQRIRKGPIPERDVLALGEQLALGLAAAHRAGVLHRDLKPGNIRVTPDGRLKILDFGLATFRAIDSGTTTSESGADLDRAGTPAYMAPEQVTGGPIDARTDIYAAGATLYEAATGRRPFGELYGLPLISAIQSREPAPVRAVNPRLSAAFERIVSKALDKDPTRRYQSAQELAVDLQRAREPRAGARVGRRSRWIAAVAGAVVLVALFGLPNLRPPTPAFQERGWVLLADFENDSGESHLDRMLSDGLTIALQQSRFVNVVPRDRTLDALRRMQRPSSATIDEATGLELCRRESFQALLTASINRSGSTTQILVKALDAAGGGLLFAESVSYSRKEELFDRVDEIAQTVRRNLGESLGGIDRQNEPLAKVTTRSFDALRHYSRAVEARARGQFDQIETPLRAALALDPEFALAHLKLGDYYSSVGTERERALSHFARAFALRDRVTERERHFIAAAYHSSLEQYEDARASLSVLVSMYPGDPEFQYELGLAHYSVGELPQAIAAVRESIRANPRSARAHGSLVLFLARQNDPAGAIAAFDAATRLGIQSPYFHWGLGLARWGSGALEAATAEFRRLAEGGGFYQSMARVHVARLDLYQGNVDRAIGSLAEALRADQKSGATAMQLLEHYLLARAYLALNRQPQAAAEADAIVALSAAAPKVDDLRRAGLLYLSTGKTTEARRLLNQLVKLHAASKTSYAAFCVEHVRGELALGEGRTAAAIAAFETAAAHVPSYETWIGLARAHESRQAWADATGAWQRVLNARGEILQDGFPLDLSLASVRLAEAARRAGNVGLACASYIQAEETLRDGTLRGAYDEARRGLRDLGCVAAQKER